MWGRRPTAFPFATIANGSGSVQPPPYRLCMGSRTRTAAVANWHLGRGVDLEQQAKRTDGEPGQPAGEARPEHMKAPYAAPVLQQWGSLRDITQSVGANGANDGGRGWRRRTR